MIYYFLIILVWLGICFGLYNYLINYWRNKKMVKQEKKYYSGIIGMLGIVVGIVLLPIVGVLFGIIGLAITKDPEHRDRDIVLNILAITASIIVWALVLYLFG